MYVQLLEEQTRQARCACGLPVRVRRQYIDRYGTYSPGLSISVPGQNSHGGRYIDYANCKSVRGN